MPVCTQIKKKKRTICIGDMRDRITLEDRDLTAVLTGVDAIETFSNTRPAWSLIETVTGVEFFNEVNVAVDVTHIVYIRFDETVTEQTWILLENNERLNILKVEDLDQRSQFQKLLCTNRGNAGKEATDG